MTIKSKTLKSGYEPKDNTGTLFYDIPGGQTLTGSIKRGKVIEVTAEPAVDKNQRTYTKISGDGISGALYENERKENDRQPAFTGPIEINREELRVAAWIKVTQSGKNEGQAFLSLSVSEKMTRQGD